MSFDLAEMRALCAVHGPVARVVVAGTAGSTPRNVGAARMVWAGGACGTIGGGALEAMAIEAARAMLRSGEDARRIDQPLGPEIGQCCGGRVTLNLRRAGREDVEALTRAEAGPSPQILIFGAGHVGAALVRALGPLPVDVKIIDSRAERLTPLADAAALVETPLPEAEVDAAPSGAAYVVLTHDHATDFLIAEAALARGDAAYVGMIGSATKRAVLAARLREAGVPDTALTCPIGLPGLRDKRPEVIAASVSAQLLLRDAALGSGAANAASDIAQAP